MSLFVKKIVLFDNADYEQVKPVIELLVSFGEQKNMYCFSGLSKLLGSD